MRAQNMPALTANILVRGLNRLGDAVMSTPALQRLRQARPEARISILTHEKLAGLWEGQPFLDEVITFRSAESVFAIGKKLRDKNFSEAVAFPNSVRSAIELRLARIPRRIGVARPGRGFFLTHALPPRPGAVAMHKRSDSEIHDRIAREAAADTFPAEAHQIHDYLYLTKALGASPDPLPPQIYLEDSKVEQAWRQLHLESESEDRPWFGLNPGAEYGPAKRWPAKRFAAAAVMLHKRTKCRWLVFGGKEDADLAEGITTEIRYSGVPPDAVLNLAGKTTLPQLAAALKRCSMVLTNDTGPMHLAAAIGTPVVVPFGSTSPELTGPSYAGNAHIVRVPPPCAPCFRRECPVDFRCMNDISMSQVIEAVNAIIDK